MNRLVLACLALFVVAAFASSHSEAPGTAKRPNADITDFYMFRCYEPGREDYTCFIMNSNPLQHPFAGPNYYTLSDDHFFELYIDNDGDSHEDITFQFFNGNSLGGAQANVPYHADEDDCVLNQNFRNVNPQPTYIRKNAGVTLPIGNQNVRVALKVVGPVTRNDQSSLNWNEWYQINYITGDRTFGTRTAIRQSGSNNVKFIKPFDNAGTKSFPNYEDYASQYVYNINIPGCNQDGRVFLGQRAESFAISLGAVFDLINFIPIPGFPGAVKEDPLNNDLRNLNIDSYVLEVPTQCIVRSGEDGVIGAWTGVRKLHHQGDDHVPGKQISRLGTPLVNELLIGLLDKGIFNTYEPHQDQGFVDFYVRYPTLPAIINLLFGTAVNSVLGVNLATIAPTNLPRDDLYAVFMTGLDGLNQPKNVVPSEMLRLNTTVAPTAAGSQNQFGVIGGDGAGFPNGRRPGDDVVDIALRVMMGRLCTLNLYCVPADAPVGNVDLTDGVPLSAANFDNAFPYLKTPYPGSTGLITA